MKYENFSKSRIKLDAFGLYKGERTSSYFCTPKNAKIIGWVGADGMHACFIKDLGEMVFFVAPMNGEPYVFPVADSFENFLRLLMSVNEFSYLETSFALKKEDLAELFNRHEENEEQAKLKALLKEKYGLEELSDPASYIKNIQDNFDLSKIKFKKDYYEWVPAPKEKPLKEPQWKVYFEGDFFSKSKKFPNQKCGAEIKVNKAFEFDGKKLHIPSVYICSNGIVADIIAEIENEKLKEFYDKWCFYAEYEDSLTDELREKMEYEHPFNLHFSENLYINGIKSMHHSGRSTNYIPEGLFEESEKNDEAQWILEYYGLKPDRCYTIWRYSFSYINNKKPKLTELKLCFRTDPRSVQGMHFVTPDEKEVKFTHPETGIEHILKVIDTENTEFDLPIGHEGEIYPSKAAMMKYTVTPELGKGELSVFDCAKSDEVKYKRGDKYSPDSAASIGIIGGADGPTAIFIGSKSEKSDDNIRTATSSLHFEYPKKIEWRTVFITNNKEEIEVLLPLC